MQKPLNQWTKADFKASVGAWRLLRTLNREELLALHSAYQQVWGEIGGWNDEQFEWLVELGRRMKWL